MSAVLVQHRPQQPRSEQNTSAAFVLALAMHALLVGALWISVQWNVEPSGAVVVELWSGGAPAPPEPVAIAPPPPPPPVKAEPEPEKPDADIVLQQEKKRLEAERRLEAEKRLEEERRLEAERKRQAEQKRREAEARRLAEEKKQLEEERKKQAEAIAQAAERKREEERRETVRKAEEARVLAQAAGGSKAGGQPGGAPAAGAGGGDPSYAGQLIALIRPRIVFAVAENTPASVYAEFQVDLLPTGEIMAVRKLKASGLPGYDEAVERAIRRTDPFPRKRDGTVDRTVIIRFRPVDAQ
ncbi:MAG: TonB C-terminal domain-containing protein [Burkholderiales bacterium]|nr:MAG: TonB C-terminal domain-containing protein [Burkholderiales bacterium]